MNNSNIGTIVNYNGEIGMIYHVKNDNDTCTIRFFEEGYDSRCSYVALTDIRVLDLNTISDEELNKFESMVSNLKEAIMTMEEKELSSSEALLEIETFLANLYQIKSNTILSK